MASVIRIVKDCCGCGHPQDNRAGSYFCVTGGRGVGQIRFGQLLSRGPFYKFGFLMMHLFLTCFSNLLMMKYGIDSSKGIFKMKQDKLREQVNYQSQ